MTRSQHDGSASNPQAPSGVDRHRAEHLSRDGRSGLAHRRAFVEDLQRTLEDLLRGARRGDPQEPAVPLVVIRQRLGAFLVSSHPHLDRCGAVVLALDEPTPALVADALDTRVGW